MEYIIYMSYIQKKTQERYNRAKNMSTEDRQKIDSLITAYIKEYHNYNTIVCSNRLYHICGHYVKKDIIAELLQDIYVWLYINYDRILECKTTAHVRNIVNKLFNTKILLTKANELLKQSNPIQIPVTYPAQTEDDDTEAFTDSLNFYLPNEDRLYHHFLELEQLKIYLYNYPHSKLKSLLECQKSISDEAYNCALHYIVTPSPSFLIKNARKIGIKNPTKHLKEFKKFLEEYYGKKTKSRCRYLKKKP